MSLLETANRSLEGVKIAPKSGELIYDNNVGKVSIDAVFPMGQEKWGTMDTVSRSQPRQHFNEKDLAALAASIAEHGQQVPIVVRRAPASTHKDRVVQYGIINGERRWRAMKSIGATEILVRLVKAEDRQAYRLSIIGDIHNVGHNAIERGQSLIEAEQDMRDELEEFLTQHLPVALEQPLTNIGYTKLLKVEHLTPVWMRRVFARALETERRPKVTDEDVALTVGITTRQIQTLTKLTTLEPEFTEALAIEEINTRHAGALLRLPDKKTRKKLFSIIKDENMSGTDAEQWVKDYLDPKQKLAGTWKLKAPDPGNPLKEALGQVQTARKILRENPQPDQHEELKKLCNDILEELATLSALLKP